MENIVVERDNVIDWICSAVSVEEKLSMLKLMVDTKPLLVQIRNNLDQTPLHCACYQNQSLSVIENLVKSYPQALQNKDVFGCTPFHWACSKSYDLSVINFLYTQFPLAARWKNHTNEMPLSSAYALMVRREGSGKVRLLDSANVKSLDIIKYLAYECWPVACLVQYTTYLHYFLSPGPQAEKVVEDVAKEALCALIDIAFHVKNILSDTVTAHITESVMLCCDKSNTTESSTTLLSLDQYRVRTLDKSARICLDCSTLLTIVKSEEIQSIVEPESGHDKVQELLDSVIRMNRVGRLYFTNDPENTRQGLKVLQPASGLNALFFHVRENPLICQRF